MKGKELKKNLEVSLVETINWMDKSRLTPPKQFTMTENLPVDIRIIHITQRTEDLYAIEMICKKNDPENRNKEVYVCDIKTKEIKHDHTKVNKRNMLAKET